MSYIRDALKRADAERERGAVPGLRSRHVATPAPQAGHGARNRIWLAVATVLALGGMAAGAWFWKMSASGVRLAAVAPAVAPPPRPAPMPALPPAVVDAPRAALSSPPAAPTAPKPVLKPAPKPTPKPAPQAAPAVAAPPPRPRPEPVAKTPVAPAAPASIRLLADLPESIRREIPPLTITGSVYSENPGKRMLLVNNQVLSQGSQVAPDVKLEEIESKSAVFSFRGTRFRVTH
ncbi:hypothetical protein BH10PSE16_BH10PSE16_31090 [soil metagenome]